MSQGQGEAREEGRGRVAEYDDHKGYGYIETDGGRRLFFHCTAIADGSRTVAPGAEVSFEITDGRMGPEATAVRETGG